MAGAAFADVVNKIHSPSPLIVIKAVLDTIYGQFAAVWNGLLATWAWLTHSQMAQASRLAVLSAKAHAFWWQYLLALIAWGVPMDSCSWLGISSLPMWERSRLISRLIRTANTKVRGSIQDVGMTLRGSFFTGARKHLAPKSNSRSGEFFMGSELSEHCVCGPFAWHRAGLRHAQRDLQHGEHEQLAECARRRSRAYAGVHHFRITAR